MTETKLQLFPGRDGGLDILEGLKESRKDADRNGISKNREVTDGVRFKFRGIDDVMNAFSGIFAEHDVMVLPAYSNPIFDTRMTTGEKPKPNYNVKVEGVFTLLSLNDGSAAIIGPVFGEANDTGDKATAKAQSISYRQAMLLAFTMPLGPKMDPEADPEQQDHDSPPTKPPVAGPKAKAPVKPVKAAKPGKEPPGSWGKDLSETQLKWARDQAGMAGYENDEQLFEKYRHAVTKDGLAALRDWLRDPANAA
jgi:hypothetical protein